MTIQNPKSKIQNLLMPWLDVVAIAAWGILMLKYWLTGKLRLLIHPDYFWLVIAGGFGLLIIGGLRARSLWLTQAKMRRNPRFIIEPAQHITLFPPGWSSTLLLVTAILGLIVTPRVFASETALQRGVTESLSMTRSQPQEFKTAKRPEERSLIDWVRTLNVYPEPDTYTGQKVKVQGFAIHPKELPEQYLMIARFVITCCAADAYPVGLPVKLTQNRTSYPPDTWLEVEGQMITEELSGKRQLTIKANSLKPISEPKNPYDY
jgi:uncharacterized repeat protein (TIGR03943 family)